MNRREDCNLCEGRGTRRSLAAEASLRRRVARRSLYLFAVSAWLLGGCGSGDERNLLIFLIDTLRADRMGLYGNPLPTSPVLDAFAREAWVFEHAYAPSPQTAASHASLFTSTYPATHGVWNEIGGKHGVRRDIAGSSRPSLLPRLAESHVTLAEALAQAGYWTVAVTDSGWVIPSRGLAQGFAVFRAELTGVDGRVDEAIELLDSRVPWRRRYWKPFFLFVHTYEVHAPYLPPEGEEDRFAAEYRGPLRDVVAQARAAQGAISPWEIEPRFFRPLQIDLAPEDRAFLVALYDAELARVDAAFARLLAALERRGELERTWIVVTSDHGEEFGEYGRFHHEQLNESTLHIPLIIRPPGGTEAARRDDLVDLVDLMPTLLAELGIAVPEGAVGRRIPLTAPAAVFETRPLVAEVNRTNRERQVSVRMPGGTVLFRGDALERAEPALGPAGGEPPQWDVLTEQARSIAVRHFEEAASLRDARGLAAVLPGGPSLSEEQLRNLRALGYVP